MTRYRQEDEAPSGITSPPLLLTNANVVTLDDDVPRGEALLLAGGRVVRVGSTADLRAHALGDIEELDVSGASVLPGFVDGHTHFEMTSTSIDQCINAHTPPCTSLADIAGVIRREIATPPTIRGSSAGRRSGCRTR